MAYGISPIRATVRPAGDIMQWGGAPPGSTSRRCPYKVSIVPNGRLDRRADLGKRRRRIAFALRHAKGQYRGRIG